MVDESFKELEKITIYAKKNKIKVIFNPSSYLAEKGIDYLRKVLDGTDALILNKEEAKYIVGNHEIDELILELKKQTKCPIVIITDGKDGTYVNDGKNIYHGIAHNIKVIETTGAGDAFGSSFVSGLIKKNNIEFAIKLAMTNAESVITHHGAKTNLLTWKKAITIMRKRPITVKKKKI
jgi:sugar/nucleoside kinase (ribokinase family)